MNKCEGCPRNCCLEFKLTQELTDPFGAAEAWRTFPFIRKIRSEIVLGPGGKERSVEVYSCDKFDPNAGECQIYNNLRPNFCLNTGEKFYPHPNCLLKKQ